jgi:hypothetical protein
VQPWSPSLVIDVIAGAIDARLHPGLVAARPAPPAGNNAEGETTMFAKLMKFRCAGFGPIVTARDQWLAVSVMLGGTIVLTAIWMAAHITYGDNPYVDAFSVMPFLIAFALSMPLTSLKGRSRGAQAIFIGGSIALLTLMCLAVGFITAKL